MQRYLTINEISEIAVSISTASEIEQIPGYDYTAINAIATCPRDGIIRYVKDKVMGIAGRSTPLEANRAMHDVYAAVRLIELLEEDDAYSEHVRQNGIRLFGADRFQEIMSMYRRPSVDEEARIVAMATSVIETSGYYDDPNDKRRTLSALYECAMFYVRVCEMYKRPVWVSDRNDPLAPIGVELPFSLTIRYNTQDGELCAFRFVGRMDGLVWRDQNRKQLIVEENKGTQRMTESWRMQFDVSHQPTGYIIAARALTSMDIRNAVVIGLSVPLPKSLAQGFERIPIVRDDHNIRDWFAWLLHNIQLVQQWKDDPINAPMSTNACHRYFRACSLIPLCAVPSDMRALAYNEMPTLKWDPLADIGTVGGPDDD